MRTEVLVLSLVLKLRVGGPVDKFIFKCVTQYRLDLFWRPSAHLLVPVAVHCAPPRLSVNPYAL